MSLIRKNGIQPEVNNFSNLDIIEDDVGFPDVVVLWAVQGVHEDVLLQVVEGQATVIPLHLPGWCCCCLQKNELHVKQSQTFFFFFFEEKKKFCLLFFTSKFTKFAE